MSNEVTKELLDENIWITQVQNSSKKIISVCRMV